MSLLLSLSGTESYENPLATLVEIVLQEIDSFKLALINARNLKPATFQVTGFGSEDYSPVYTAEEMLNTSPDFPVLEGRFIESWKSISDPFEISCESCPDLFQGELKYFGRAIVIPIWVNSEVERWVVLVNYPDNSVKSNLDKLSLLLNYALTNILRNEQKRQLDKARKWIDFELSEISRIQSLLLPVSDLEISGTEVAFKFKAFKEAGGDYLDLFELPRINGEHLRWGGIIADVTGHGPSAAVEAAMVDAILRTFPGNDSSTPAEVANYLNHHYFTKRDRGKFVTAMLFSYRGDTKKLSYVSAGHPNGLIKRGNEVFTLDKSQGIPIGVLRDYQWEAHEFDMLPGDILFICTDVVLETRSPQGEEYGSERLEAILKEAPACPHKVIEIIEQSLFEFNDRKDLQDDLTLSAIQLK